VIDVRAVFQQGHRELNLEPCPSSFYHERTYGLRDYEKMFCPDLKAVTTVCHACIERAAPDGVAMVVVAT